MAAAWIGGIEWDVREIPGKMSGDCEKAEKAKKQDKKAKKQDSHRF